MRPAKYTARHAAPSSGALSAAVPVSGALAAAVPAALGMLAPAVPAVVHADLDARAVHQAPAARPLVTRVTSASSGMSYMVAAGDTLSGIAARSCGNSGDWPAIWHADQAEVPDPDLIYPGQTLRFTCDELSAQAVSPTGSAAGPAPPAAGVSGVPGGILSCAALEALWQQAGGAPGEAFMAAEIAKAESGGNPDAISSTDDLGLWQINKTAWGSLATLDPLANARAAVQISADGTTWSPWVTYQQDLYKGRC